MEKQCEHCRKVFRVDPYRSETAHYCSRNCADIHRSIELKCDVCGEIFRRAKSNVKIGYKHQFCSSKCFHGWTVVTPQHRKQMAVSAVRRYRQEHPGWNRNIKAKRRALQYKCGGSFSNDEWDKLKDKYEHTCLMCGKVEPEIKLTVDHIVSLHRWSDWIVGRRDIGYNWNDIENIQPLCQSCNSSKNKRIADFRGKI